MTTTPVAIRTCWRRRRAARSGVGRLDRPGVARFPKPRNRIPNFVGAEAAAAALADTDEWRAARVLKANPDSPQWPVRTRALEDGKVVYMAVPRLAEADPFFLLDPESSPTPPQGELDQGRGRSASTIGIDDLEPVDLVVTGCVAVDERDGARLGKGGGFSDLELALAAAAGLVDERHGVVTTVHADRCVDAGTIPVTAHDFHLDLIVTAGRGVRCRACPAAGRCPRLEWDQLTDDKVASIPLLERLRRSGASGG